MGKRSRKFLATEILIGSSILIVLLLSVIGIIIYNSIQGTRAIKYRKEAATLENRIDYLENQTNFISDLHFDLINNGYQIPNNIHTFINSITKDSVAFHLHKQLVNKGFLTNMDFPNFVKQLPPADSIRKLNSLKSSQNYLMDQHRIYHNSKLTYNESIPFIKKIIITYIIAIYPLRFLILGLMWAIKVYKE